MVLLCVAKLYVVETRGPINLGLPTCEELSLVTIHTSDTQNPDIHTVLATTHHNSSEPITTAEHLQHLYPDCFEGLGRFSGTAHIQLDPTVCPVVHAPWKCPIHLREDLEKELDEM